MSPITLRQAEQQKLNMVAQILLEDAFRSSYRRWRLAGNAITVRECIADESADALALCRQLGVPTSEARA